MVPHQMQERWQLPPPKQTAADAGSQGNSRPPVRDGGLRRDLQAQLLQLLLGDFARRVDHDVGGYIT